MTDLQELMALLEQLAAHVRGPTCSAIFNELDAALRSPAFAEMARNDARYRMLRNGLSDFHGDCYAMTFDPDGDYPVSGADLDNRADRMIERHAQRHGRGEG